MADARKAATKIMFLMRRAPYGTRFEHGGLEAALVMGAYEQDISFLFIDDGVFSIKTGMDTTGIGIKNFSSTFLALEGYDINKIYVDKQSLSERGLSIEDLVIDVEVVDSEAIKDLLEAQDVILPF